MRDAITHALAGFCLGLAVLALIALTGCAHKPLRNYQPGVPTRVFIDLSKCHDGQHGDYYCPAHFVPLVVNVK